MDKTALLAIETAGHLCQVALDTGARTFSRSERGGRGQEGRLFTLISQLFVEAELSIEAIAGVAVSRGPGSFTGLRTGLAAAHGLALARSIPLGAWSAFEIASFAARAALRETGTESVRTPLWVILDARRREPFLACFQWAEQGPLWGPAVDEDHSRCARDLAAILSANSMPLALFGDGLSDSLRACALRAPAPPLILAQAAHPPRLGRASPRTRARARVPPTDTVQRRAALWAASFHYPVRKNDSRCVGLNEYFARIFL